MLLENCRLENMLLAHAFGLPIIMEMKLHMQQCGAGDCIVLKTPLGVTLL